MEWDSRARRMVMIYLPLSCFVLILLFSVLLMAITSFKPNAELLNYKGPQSVLDLFAHARAHQASAVRDRLSALADDDDVGGRSAPPSSRCSPVRWRLCDRAPAF